MNIIRLRFPGTNAPDNNAERNRLNGNQLRPVRPEYQVQEPQEHQGPQEKIERAYSGALLGVVTLAVSAWTLYEAGSISSEIKPVCQTLGFIEFCMGIN